MNDWYSDFVNDSVQFKGDAGDTDRERLGLAALGLLTEGGEAMDHIKKVLYHNKPLDREALILELGDHLWYLTLLLHTLKIHPLDVMAKNILKLTNRFPDKYGDRLYEYRDLADSVLGTPKPDRAGMGSGDHGDA